MRSFFDFDFDFDPDPDFDFDFDLDFDLDPLSQHAVLLNAYVNSRPTFLVVLFARQNRE